MLEQSLLPPTCDLQHHAAGNASDLMVVIGKEVPDEQQAVPDSGAANPLHKRLDRGRRHPGNRNVEGCKVEISSGDPRRMTPAQDELARIAHQPSGPPQHFRPAPHHPDARCSPELLHARTRRRRPVEVQHLHVMARRDQGVRELRREIGLPRADWVLHGDHQESHYRLNIPSTRRGGHNRCS